MDTPTAIMWSQIPIAIVIIIGIYELYRTRKYLTKLLEKLIKK